MDSLKSYSGRSLFVILFFMFVLMLLFDAGLYFGIEHLDLFIKPSSDVNIIIPWLGVELIKDNVENILKIFNTVTPKEFFSWYLPASGIVFTLLGVFLWLFLKILVSEIFKKIDVKNNKPAENKKEKKDFADQRIEQERKRRIFLHFISVLQREGRLLDFFDEDLELYDDEQIGAAVRSIQEDCKKTVQKYLALGPVIDKEEGDSVEVEPGFDPDSIRLTGNVAGDPPFTGILRHRGWKAGKKEIPKLSDVLDSGIMMPAEVEIE